MMEIRGVRACLYLELTQLLQLLGAQHPRVGSQQPTQQLAGQQRHLVAVVKATGRGLRGPAPESGPAGRGERGLGRVLREGGRERGALDGAGESRGCLPANLQ